MRQRLSWNLDKVAEQMKKADPYTMNQEHANNPVEKYHSGDPDSWGETPDMKTPWKNEGRDETGHPAPAHEAVKAARMLEDKALKCITIAQRMLPGAVDAAIEEQATDLMYLPERSIMATLQRQAELAETLSTCKDDDDDDATAGKKDEDEDKEAKKKDDEEDVEAKKKDDEEDVEAKKKDDEEDVEAKKKDEDDEGMKTAHGKGCECPKCKEASKKDDEDDKEAKKKDMTTPPPEKKAKKEEDEEEVKAKKKDDDEVEAKKKDKDEDIEAKKKDDDEVEAKKKDKDEEVEAKKKDEEDEKEASVDFLDQFFAKEETVKTGAKKLSGIVKQASASSVGELSNLWDAPPDVSKNFK